MADSLDYDIVIAGAGMVGASLAIALAPTGLRIAIVESVSPRNADESSFDDRGITLAPSSRNIFERLGVWQQLRSECYPIKNIHVSEQGRFGFARLHANEAGCEELGYVVLARALGHALLADLQRHDNIELICPAELKNFERNDMTMQVTWQQQGELRHVRTGLLVGADGSHSLVRRLAGINVEQKDFEQTAIVANITTQKPNQATAFERFTPHGPIALLPIGDNRSVLVYVVARNEAQTCMTMSDAGFVQHVQQELGRRLGRIEQLGKRRSYPLLFQQAQTQYQPQLLLLGNSVHTLHPNAAQGFNLGLRDVAGLVDAVHDGLQQGMSVNDVRILERYTESREADQKRVVRFTNGLAKTFYNDWPLLASARNGLMLLVDIVPALKQQIVATAMGKSGHQPTLVRGHA